VYLLLNNKIFIFKPNTNSWMDTRDLTYIWQIEEANKKIKDFFINYDWESSELIILNDAWVYKLNFEISNDRIVIR
jgi:hypothetical protein